MTTDENGSGIRPALHRFSHPASQILFIRSVVDDWNFERVKERQCLAVTTDSDTLDHLLVRDTECWGVVRQQHRQQDCSVSSGVTLGTQKKDGPAC